MAIIYSYPLNDDIKPLDELVGTTEKNINGQLKTVTRNFLLSDLAEFFIVDGGLQKTITLTTDGSSGVSTLDQVTGVLNIPDYSSSAVDSPITIVNGNSLFSTGLTDTGTGATNATDSIFLGQVAGYEATNASNSNFLGFGAGFNATDANNSNFFGPQAGYQATTAERSNFIGDSAGKDAANANNSNFIGPNTGYAATNASYSNFIGDSAGNGANYASYSNFLGYQAGLGAAVEDVGNFNSNFIGYQAGYQAEFARNSNFIGENAGYLAANAISSNFLGRITGYEATDAHNSNFFGDAAGYAATNASGSNFFGNGAGDGGINAYNSNFIGNGAGKNAAYAHWSNFLGYDAGNNASDANNSVLIGFNVGSAVGVGSIGSNNIIIGTNISLSPGVTNSLNLGGVLFGTGTYSTISGDPSIVPTSGGKIGIGVVSPTSTLHIYSEAEDTSGLRLERLTSTSPTSTGQAIGVDASGNVVTVEGSGGSQDLQSVTDIGATTTNKITINPIGDINGLEINATGDGGGLRIITQAGVGIYSQSYDTAFTGNSDYGMNLVGFVQGLNIYSDQEFVASFSQGLTAKGLLINSGTSSSGNFIELNKNSVNKLIVNQAGELTAEKLIKNGGTSSQILAADGSVITAGTNITISGGTISSTSGGVTSVTATSPITSSGGTTPAISTSMATNKLIGRSTAGTGIMEEITVGSGLTLSAGTLTNTATPTPLGYYGAFQDMLTQTLTTANVGQPFLIRTVDESNQVSITTNGSGEYTRITPANTGIYNIQWSGQFQNPTNAIHDVNIWFRKGLTSSSGPGTDIVGSNGLVALPARKSASVGEEGHIVTGWNFLLTIAAGEYVEFYWMSSSTQVTLQAYSAGSPPPSTASLIVTVTQQSGIMAGTGITALGTSGNSQTGATQTLATNGSGTDFNIVSSGNTHTFNLPSASATARGVVTTGIQTFAGAKTFSSNPKIPVNGGNSGVGALVIENGTGQIEVATNYLYPNLTEIQTVKGVTGSIQTQFSGKQDKSLSAYSMIANNTASTANATEFTFRRWNQATYGGTPAWVGTSAPTTITAQSYSGQQVGNMVSINLSVVYTNAGIANTQVTLPLPSDFPTPLSPTGFTAGLDVIAYGTGQIMANTAQTVATGARGCFLRRNTANNGYEFFLNVSVATAAKVVMLNLTYQTS